MASVPTNVCVHCGCTTASVFVQYSPGNIRLSSCGCKRLVDEYVECENLVRQAPGDLIVLIDLILLKPEAFRHVFFNHFTWNAQTWRGFVWRASTLLLALDLLQKGVHGDSNKVRWHSFSAFATSFGNLLLTVCVSNFLFISIACLGAKVVSAKGRSADVILALLISSYFRLFGVATLVWEFSPTMVAVLELLAMSSNMVGLKVMLNTTTSTSIATIVIAAVGRKAAACVVESYLFDRGYPNL